LEPHLGVVDLGDFRTFVIADIPGLIEGAHEGHGLGDRFLRHVERTKLLLHLVDVSSASGRDSVSDYEVINRELEAYDPRLIERAQFVIATKIDALDEPERLERLRERAEQDGRAFFAISAVAGKGVRELLAAIARELEQLRVNVNTGSSYHGDESLLIGSGSTRF
jgi:GTP-binding protein